MYYLQSRYYDPAIGRFINADVLPTTDPDGFLSCNMFAYCENNPINFSDPYGLLKIKFKNGTLQIKLENKIDRVLFVLANDAVLALDLYAFLFFASLTVGSSMAVPLAAGCAFAALDALAKLGLDYAIAVNDIYTAQSIMDKQGYAYFCISPSLNPLSTQGSRVSEQPRISDVSVPTTVYKPNQVNSSRIIAQIGQSSIRLEPK